MKRAATALPLLLALLQTPTAARAQTTGATPPPQEEDPAARPALEATVEGRAEADPAASTTSGKQASELAGAHGDAIVAAQSLPGVGRPPIGSGQLVVWGADPAQTKLLVEGIEVPALYHFGGLRSVIPTELVDRIALHPAAFGAQYGRALGGVLDVALEVPSPDDFHFKAAVDPLDAHAAGLAQVGSAKIHAGARYSLIDRTLGPLLSDSARALVPLPRDFDGQLVAETPLRDGETLELLLFGSSDSSQRELDLSDPSVSRGDGARLRWGRLGARYKKRLDDGASAQVTVWLGDELQTQNIFYGPLASSLDRWAQTGGLRASWTSPLATFAQLTLGVDALYTHSTLERDGSLTSAPREGDLSAFGEAPAGDVAFDRWRVAQTNVGLFGELHLEWRRLEATAGLRVDANSSDVSRVTPRAGLTPQVGLDALEWYPEPRLSLSFHAATGLSLFAAAGLHHQPADPADLSAVFGTPTLESSRAVHALAGANYRASSLLDFEASGFYRRLDDLPTRSTLASPLLAHSLVQQGTGGAAGGQFTARINRSGRLSGYLEVLVSRSTRTDAPGEPSRLFDFDQPLLVTASGDWKLRLATLSARFRLASGYPRTPVIGTFLDSKTGILEPLFGAHNAERLSLFAQLDLRASHLFHLGEKATLQVSLDVLNATDRSNAEEYVYSSNWQNRAALTGLPIVALLGLELTL